MMPLAMERDDLVETARRALAQQPRRLAHVLAVHARACTLTLNWPRERIALLERVALLHDIGYAIDPEQRVMHAATGARLLEDHGMTAEALIVARHTGAFLEASLRGCVEQLDPWRDRPCDENVLLVLDWLDLTTGPAGERMTVGERTGEVMRRHGGGSVQAMVMRSLAARARHGEILARPIR